MLNCMLKLTLRSSFYLNTLALCMGPEVTKDRSKAWHVRFYFLSIASPLAHLLSFIDANYSERVPICIAHPLNAQR